MQMFQFHINLACLNARLAKCLNKFLIVNALVDKDKALVGAFSGYYKTSRRFVDSSTNTAGVCRDQVQGVAWQWEGALLATEAKDRTVRVFDPRWVLLK